MNPLPVAATAALVHPFSGALLSAEPIKGQVTVANESSFEAANLSQSITAYVAGRPAPDLEQQLDRLFPPIPTARVAEFAVNEDAAFLTETDDSDIREPNAAFKRTAGTGTKQLIRVRNKGLTWRQDHDLVSRDNMDRAQPGWEEAKALSLRHRLVRADLLRGLAAVRAAAVNTNVTWDAASNPDGDARAMVQAGFAASGLRPNRIVYGGQAFQIRQDAYEDPARSNNHLANHGDYALEQIARYLQVDLVDLVEDFYQVDRTEPKARILSNEVLCWNAKPGLTEDDPSNIKRFRAMTDQGTEWAVYIDRKTKWTDITVEHYSVYALPILGGIRKLTVSA